MTATPHPSRRPRVARRAGQALATLAVSTGTVVVLADAAHARIALNHNESAGRERPARTGRARRALTRVAATVAVSGGAVVLLADAAHARLATNHNESPGRDGA
jgi:hypothetical protein